jgi:hypothetical protein
MAEYPGMRLDKTRQDMLLTISQNPQKDGWIIELSTGVNKPVYRNLSGL